MNNQNSKREQKVPRRDIPKRNKNRFLIFSMETRQKLKEEGIRLNSNEMMEKLAELWRELPHDEKAKYDELALTDKNRYLEERRVFKQKYPDVLLENRTKRNYTKKPVSGYGMFLAEMKNIVRKEIHGVKMAEVLQIVSVLWKKLCQDEVDRYQRKSSREKELKRKIYLENKEGNKGRRNRQKRLVPTQDVPKPSKKIKNVQGTFKTLIFTQNEVLEEVKSDEGNPNWSYDHDQRGPSTEELTSTTSQNDWDLGYEPQEEILSREESFLVDDYEYLLTAWKISKKKSVVNFGQDEDDDDDDLLRQVEDFGFNGEVDLFNFTLTNKSLNAFSD